MRVPHEIRLEVGEDLREGLHAAGHAILNVLPLYGYVQVRIRLSTVTVFRICKECSRMHLGSLERLCNVLLRYVMCGRDPSLWFKDFAA